MNRRTRFCRPLHNHFATPPRSVGLRRPILRARLAAPEAKLDCNAPAPKAPAPGAADRGAEKRGPAPPFSHPPRGRESQKPGRPSIGAGNEARTRDLNLGKVALYQLSYSRNAAKSKIGTAARARTESAGQRQVVERETRFELATSTLGRLRSTN